MASIIWSKRAFIDLEDIAEFIAKDSMKFANITVSRIIQDAEKLKNNPLLGRIVPEVNNEKYRELIRGNYRIIYTYDEMKVSVLSIHHSSRDL